MGGLIGRSAPHFLHLIGSSGLSGFRVLHSGQSFGLGFGGLQLPQKGLHDQHI